MFSLVGKLFVLSAAGWVNKASTEMEKDLL